MNVFRRSFGVHFTPPARDDDGLGSQTMTDAEWYRCFHAKLKLDHPDTATYKCVIATIIKWGDAGNTANNRSSHVCLMSLGNFTAEGKRSPAGKVCVFLSCDSKRVYIYPDRCLEENLN